MYRKTVSQDDVVKVLKGKVEQVLARPGAYIEGVEGLRGLLLGYTDSLALACSGYTGGFMYPEIPQIDPEKTEAENTAAILSAVQAIIDDVPNENRAVDLSDRH